MLNYLLKRFRRLHMVGIGGSGMSGIAEILLMAGFKVTGSDPVESGVTRRLEELGATIFHTHKASNVDDAEFVIYTSAVNENHVELAAARERNIPVIRRAEMLGELMRMKNGVAISGTHGKTTTTSLTGEVLSVAGLEPTVIVGGRLCRLDTGAISGGGEFIVAEADEFDKSFLKLIPTVVVITNIDSDHIECYGSYQELENAFVQFANSVPFYGRAILCLDEKSLLNVIPRIDRKITTYGFSPNANVRASEVKYDQGVSIFTVENGEGVLGQVKLPLPGRHNVLNSLAAIAVGRELGIEFKKIKEALEQFKGVHRRFEIIGEANGIMVADDFAHHPAEMAATFSAAKEGWRKPIIAVFQPHLFSRTKELATEFGRALLGADIAMVLPIYPAREAPIEGVTSKLIYDAAKELGHKNIIDVKDRNEVPAMIKKLAHKGDMVLTVGAGDIYKLAPIIVEELNSR